MDNSKQQPDEMLLPHQEIADDEKIATGAVRTLSTELSGLLRTDIGNARKLVCRHGKDLRYCQGTLLVWEQTHWAEDLTGEWTRRAKDTAKKIFYEAAHAKDDDETKMITRHALKSCHLTRIKAMIELAQSELEIALLPIDLDGDPWLLNVQNGTLNLLTGELREHRRKNLITKLIPVDYDPDAQCPEWVKFLDRIMGGNQGEVSGPPLS